MASTSSANVASCERERQRQRNSILHKESLNLYGQTPQKEQEDPFHSLIALSQISPSQQHLLSRTSFVTKPDNETPPCSAEAPHDSDAVVMVSLPETQVAGEGASGSRPPRLDRCTVKEVIDVSDDESLGFVDLHDSQVTGCVDLGTDSDLGFAVEEGNGKRKRGCGIESISDFDALKILKENYGGDEEDDGLENAFQKKKKISVFDVLRVLQENSDDKEDCFEDVSLLEAFMLCGMTLPRPTWWLDNDFFKKQSLA